MRKLLLALVIVGTQGCASSYHYFSKADQNTEWEGPYYSDARANDKAYSACNAVAFSGPYAIRIHFDDSSEVRTYVCSEYPNYK